MREPPNKRRRYPGKFKFVGNWDRIFGVTSIKTLKATGRNTTNNILYTTTPAAYICTVQYIARGLAGPGG